MAIWDKLLGIGKKKDISDGVVTGGFDLLRRLTASDWSKGKMLEQYEKSLYLFACVSKIAEKVSSIDLDLYEIMNVRGDTQELINHPALDLLYRVNPFQTKTEFMKITVINLETCGDAFWYKIRNNQGEVVELWNLRPDLVTIVKDPVEFIKGYTFRKSDGSEEKFAPDEIVHFRNPTPLDEYYGVSVVKSAAIRIDTEEFASTYQRDFFLNNARPDAVLKTAGNLRDEQKKDLRDSFSKQHRGVGKNSKLAILEAGLEYQQISISQREMDFIESMKFTRDDILVAFGVPKPIISITDDVNLANAKTALEIFLGQTIKPRMESIVEKINEMLISPDFGEELYIEFDDPTPQDRTRMLEEYTNGTTNGWLLINEIRQREGLEPIEGGWELYKPLGIVPVGGLSAQKKQIAKFAKAFLAKKREEANTKRLRVFRGKELLRKKLLIKGELTKAVKGEVSRMARKEEETEQEAGPRSLIKGAELRTKYVDMVNKGIDHRADRLKGELLKIAHGQQSRLMGVLNDADFAKLKKNGTKTLRTKLGKNTKKIVSDFYKEDRELFADFVFPFVEEYVRSAGTQAMGLVNPDKGFEMTDSIRKALEKRAKQFGLEVNNTTRDRITDAITAGLEAGEGRNEISSRITAVYDEFPTWRADMIARTESTAANNDGFIHAFKQSDTATGKEWIATIDDRTRDEHLELDGEIVDLDKNFSNGLPYPQEVNCRCVIGPATLE